MGADSAGCSLRSTVCRGLGCSDLRRGDDSQSNCHKNCDFGVKPRPQLPQKCASFVKLKSQRGQFCTSIVPQCIQKLWFSGFCFWQFGQFIIFNVSFISVFACVSDMILLYDNSREVVLSMIILTSGCSKNTTRKSSGL